MNKLLKNILQALVIAAISVVLLNLTFLFYAIFQNAISRLILGDPFWPPLPLVHILFLVVIGAISWVVFDSKLFNTFWKAAYTSVPLAVALVFIGIIFYRLSVMAYLLGALVSLGVLYYLWRAKKSWFYFYTVILVSLALGIFTLLGGEI